MLRCAVIESPSILGLRPTGVETLPEALLQAGLIDRLSARHAGRVTPERVVLESRQTDTLSLSGAMKQADEDGWSTTVLHLVGDSPEVLLELCADLGEARAFRGRVAAADVLSPRSGHQAPPRGLSRLYGGTTLSRAN